MESFYDLSKLGHIASTIITGFASCFIVCGIAITFCADKGTRHVGEKISKTGLFALLAVIAVWAGLDVLTFLMGG